MTVSKIRLPDNTEHNVNDARFPGIVQVDELDIDSSPTVSSDNLVTSGGVYTALSEKQNTLVSGTNIKTINDQSILGSGNITVSVDVSGKADKVANATNGDFAALDSSGNLTDSGKKNSDFVHVTGNETISGLKTFSNTLLVDSIYAHEQDYSWIQDEYGGSIQEVLDEKEVASNKVTSLSSSSTNNQYPSAKCVWDIIGDIETLINAL